MTAALRALLEARRLGFPVARRDIPWLLVLLWDAPEAC